jgi:hypothetical protein
MLPLAETEKLIREKDEEVSKNLASPSSNAPGPLRGLSLASPGPTPALLPRTAAPHARDAGEDAGPDAAEPGSRRADGRSLRPPAMALPYLGSALVRLLSNPRALDCPAGVPARRPALALALCGFFH